MQSQNLIIHSLTVQNFATFTDQTILFSNGFNALVGETGSGKSLVLDALQLILGQRADKKLVRKNCEYTVIEATFYCQDSYIKEYFNSIGFPFEDNEITIKRIIYKNGKTKSFLNFQNCNLNILSDFSKKYVDLVGQFENQKLLSSEYQLKLLDNFSQNEVLVDEYQREYLKLSQLKNELEELKGKDKEISQRLDYINFQIEELSQAEESIKNEEKLLERKKSILELEDNRSLIDHLIGLIDGNDNTSGVINSLNVIEKKINNNILTDELFDKFLVAKDSIQEISYHISQSLNDDSFEEELESILNELDMVQRLKRKFKLDSKALIGLLEEFINEKNEIESLGTNIQKITTQIIEQEKSCKKLAEAITKRRKKYAVDLAKALSNEVSHLRMKGATIVLNIESLKELNSQGNSKVAFVAETNPGEGFYPIKEIASGGELSRILLALRTVLSSRDSISVFLFDEIDTGIGGETALTVGESLKKVAESSQVIAITHLPQIAKYSDRMIKVFKEITKTKGLERTISNIEVIEKNKIKKEVENMRAL